MKNQKGITLVALVITIIVMLILVGVTVSVALNGGLFDTAKKAKTQTILEREKEELMSVVLEKYNVETGAIEITESELPEGWTKSEEIYVSANGNKFTVKENGIVEEYKVPWYNLTEEEKAEISALEGAADIDADGNGTYYIAYSEENDCEYAIAIAMINGNVGYIQIQKAEIDPSSDEYVAPPRGLTYISSEKIAEEYSQLLNTQIKSNTWYYSPIASHFGENGTVEYTGNLDGWIPSNSNGITCQSYLDRLVENFNK